MSWAPMAKLKNVQSSILGSWPVTRFMTQTSSARVIIVPAALPDCAGPSALTLMACTDGLLGAEIYSIGAL